MWPWIIGGMVVLWLLRGGRIGMGSAVVPQLPGTAGIVQTVGLMRTMTNEAIADPLIRQHAVRATEHVGRRNPKAAAVAIGEWVRGHMRYVPDPLRHEHLTNPKVIAKAISQGRKVYGDCDDMSMYVAALAKSIGMQPIFHAAGRKDRIHHVYTEIAGVPVDPTVSFGLKPFDARRRISIRV
jgi:transglutaminase-like putative cysteine protease